MATNEDITNRNPLIDRVDTRSEHGINLIVGLLDRRSHSYTAAQLAEYIAEAEHQDGDAYWDNFPDIDALLEDFDLYFATLSDLDSHGLDTR